VPQARLAVVATVAPTVPAVVVPVMAKESGMGWLGISGEQAMAGLTEYGRLIRAEARRSVTDKELEQFTSRWNEDRNAFRVTELYSGPSQRQPWDPPWTAEFVPRREPVPGPVEAFTACPACHTMHLPLIITLRRTDELLIVVRECQHCADRWQQQESL
jgi:hypothetical protein